MRILHRIEGERAHFLTVTWWESREAIAAFAGQDIELAKYYPEDPRFLLELERTVTHWEASGAPGPGGEPANGDGRQPPRGD